MNGPIISYSYVYINSSPDEGCGQCFLGPKVGPLSVMNHLTLGQHASGHVWEGDLLHGFVAGVQSADAAEALGPSHEGPLSAVGLSEIGRTRGSGGPRLALDNRLDTRI